VWLTTHEAETTPAIKEKFLAASSADTRRSRSLTGKPARMLHTPWTDEWERPDGPGPLPMPIQPLLVAPALQRIARVAGTEGSGGQRLATYFVGQVVGAMNTVKPTRRVVLEMVEEFIEAVERLDDLVHAD
jgi:NAD(P)H-dependent flavin oxidoreductase YrpB (nitropropane dioxygenase family)